MPTLYAVRITHRPSGDSAYLGTAPQFSATREYARKFSTPTDALLWIEQCDFDRAEWDVEAVRIDQTEKRS